MFNEWFFLSVAAVTVALMIRNYWPPAERK